ncbi:MAG: hypothetical protein H6876_11835 [Hyphomicrobiaceae bacterium]|nr:hypothetical protein [Hyphomicrobiaceae bacterium]MCC0008796.1 hypothetical protein [Hyphomicrobiaceae bacterium]
MMDEATWNRHANPWSVWTRALSLPPLLAAIWSHTTLGWWAALPIGLMGLWLWLNPRLFPPPAHTDTWASKVTFGERVWLNRTNVPIPAHHARAAALLSGLAGVTFTAALAGAIANNLAWTVGAGSLSWVAKMWFADRMVWLFEDMKSQHPNYRKWLR